MNFQSLFYFQTVQTEGSIQQAAAKLHISPQALSEHIKRMEEELGVPLLHRTRPVTLTEGGKRFGTFCGEVLLQKYRLERELLELQGAKRQLVISTPLRGTPPFLAAVIKRFSEECPACSVHVQERSQELSPVELRKYDLSLSMQELGDGMEQLKIRMGPRGAPASGTSDGYLFLADRKLLQACWGEQVTERLAQLETSGDIALLNDLPYIHFTDAEVTASLEQQLAALKFVPRVAASADNTALCFALCLSGVGASIVPDDWLRDHAVPEDFFVYPLPVVTRTQNLYLGYEKGKKLTDEEQTFIRIFMQELG